MRLRRVRFLVLIFAGGTTLSLLYAQDRSPAPLKRPAAPAETTPASKTPATSTTRDFSHYGPLQRQLLNSTLRGADWLYRMNGVKGRFLYGYLPAVKLEMEGDHYLRQVGAAFALARAARFSGEERYAVRATQAILALLEETLSEAGDPPVRHTALSSVVANRLGAAGLLVLAINELPAPQADLLDKSEQLCNFIRRQARADGSLRCDDAAEEGTPDDIESINTYPGLALHALVRSQAARPAPWKLDLLRKAVAFYRPWWQAHRSLAFIPAQTAAYTEAFLLTKEPPFAGFVAEMNDWLCSVQYDEIEPRHLSWFGGFATWADGRKMETAPDVGTAPLACALADASRVARAGGDAERFERYVEAAQRALQFLVTLQYADANTQHFADWYRPRIVGAFHPTHQDGSLRIDYTSAAVAALVRGLELASP
jgi:hypothetical protein